MYKRQALGAGAKVENGACQFEAGDEGERRFFLILAIGHQQIGEVQAAGMDGHARLTRSGDRIGQGPQGGGAAEGIDLPGAHPGAFLPLRVPDAGRARDREYSEIGLLQNENVGAKLLQNALQNEKQLKEENGFVRFRLGYCGTLVRRVFSRCIIGRIQKDRFTHLSYEFWG